LLLKTEALKKEQTAKVAKTENYLLGEEKWALE